MCGIFAVMRGAGRRGDRPPVEPDTIDRALGALAHRGPDGRGVYLAPDRRFGLGHTLLAIQLPGGGCQPLRDRRRRLVAVVNGEFYDTLRLRKPARERRTSDSAVLLPLYARYGLACLERLRGEFAFVLVDEGRGRLFAARDRFGVKPLCYSLHGDRLYLASEAKALFAAGVPCRWDRESLAHATAHQYLPPDRTLFAGVRQLRPGQYLVFEDGRLSVGAYWDLEYPPATEARPGPGLSSASARIDSGEAAGLLRERLDRAVGLRLQAGVGIACHLSGGLDSSSILALAARRLPRPPPCFSIRFTGAGAADPGAPGLSAYDEGGAAQALARELGADIEFVRVSQNDILACLGDAVYHAEGFAINGQLSAKYLLNRAIRRAGYRVALSGEGSDELFAGYAHLQLDLARCVAGDETGADLARSQAAILNRNANARGVMLPLDTGLAPGDGRAVRAHLGGVPAWLEAKAGLGQRVSAVLSDDFRADLAGRPLFARLMEGCDPGRRLRRLHPVDRAAYLWSRLALSGYILRALGDGMEMAFAVEGRPPFLDHDLFEFTRELAPDLRMAPDENGIEKGLLRKAMAGLLPPAVLARPKQPLLAPPLSLYAAPELREHMRAMLDRQILRELPFFDGRRLLRTFDAAAERDATTRAALEPVFMIALCAAAIQERFSPEY